MRRPCGLRAPTAALLHSLDCGRSQKNPERTAAGAAERHKLGLGVETETFRPRRPVEDADGD